MKKHLILFLFLSLGFTLTAGTYARAASAIETPVLVKPVKKYAILVRNAQHLKAAVMTGEALRKENSLNQFEIVVIGDVVKNLGPADELNAAIETSRKQGLKIVACEYAMDQFNVKKADINPSVMTTPNAFIYFFELQEKGFKTITL